MHTQGVHLRNLQQEVLQPLEVQNIVTRLVSERFHIVPPHNCTAKAGPDRHNILLYASLSHMSCHLETSVVLHIVMV